MAETIISKTCTKCKIEKPLTEFYTDKTKAGGYQRDCKVCRRQQVREYDKTPAGQATRKRYRHSEKAHDYNKEYKRSEIGKAVQKRHQAGPKGKATKKRFRQRHKVAIKEYMQRYLKHYLKTDHAKELRKQQYFNARRKHSDRFFARSVVCNAVRDGILKPAKTFKCSCCPVQAKEWHHWRGYAPEHWLDVIPLCMPCHKIADSQNGQNSPSNENSKNTPTKSKNTSDSNLKRK